MTKVRNRTWPSVEASVWRAAKAQKGDVVFARFRSVQSPDVRKPKVTGAESELIDHVIRTPRVPLVEATLLATGAVIEAGDGLQW